MRKGDRQCTCEFNIVVIFRKKCHAKAVIVKCYGCDLYIKPNNAPYVLKEF
jgi:hypothetical protein